MAARVPLSAALRRATMTPSPFTPALRRGFQSSPARCAEAVPLPASKPVGAFRGGLFGFLLGSTLAGGAVYYYVLEEYKISNELLTEDIYKLQATVQDVHTYVQTLEDKIAKFEKK